MISPQWCRWFFKKKNHLPLEQYITWSRTTQCQNVRTHRPHCMQEDKALSKPVVKDSLYPMISRLLSHAQWLISKPPSHRGLGLYCGYIVAVLWLYCDYIVTTLWLHCDCIEDLKSALASRVCIEHPHAVCNEHPLSALSIPSETFCVCVSWSCSQCSQTGFVTVVTLFAPVLASSRIVSHWNHCLN